MTLEVKRSTQFHINELVLVTKSGNIDISAIFEEIKDQPRIVLVNTAVPRSWREDNNALIAQYAVMYGAYLVDWAAISNGHPEYFAPDGVHLVPAGVRAYVDAITIQL